MASSNTTLAVKFTGNADDLIRVVDKIKRDMGDMSGSVDASFAKVSGSADKHTSKIKSAFENMGSSIKNSLGAFGGGGFAAVAGIGAIGIGLDSVVKAAETAQTAMASFKTQLAAVGVTNKGTVSGVNSMIEKMSLASGITVPHLETAYDQLIRATRDTASAHQYLSLSLNIAAGTHKSVEQAAQMVSRAYVSGGTSLRRYGINVVTVTTAQTHLKDVIAAYTAAHGKMDQAEKDHFATLTAAAKLTDKHTQAVQALAEAQKVFAGQETAREGTTAAAQQRLGNAFEILKVKLGTLLLPVIAAVTTAMANFLTWAIVNWPKVDHAIQPVLQNIATGWNNYAKPAITNLVAACAWLVSQIRQNWNTIYGILNPFFVFFKNQFTALVTIIQGVVLIIKGIFTGNWTDIWKGMKDIVGGAMSDVKNILQLAVTEVGVLALDIGRAIYNGITEALTGLGNWFISLGQTIVNSLVKGIESLASAVVNAVTGIIKSIPGGSLVLSLLGGSTTAQRATMPSGGVPGINAVTHHASGGVVPGPAGAGDVVPAMLTPGEVVLNSAQQQMIGPSNIMRALSATGGMIGGTRFASGGMAGLSGSQQKGAKAIIDVFTKYGLDPAGGIAVALNESSLNPTAVGDGGTSFGLFQLHQGGALGSHSKAWAFNPVNNATAAAVADVAAGGRGLGGRALQLLQTKAFERPSNPTADNSSANYTTAASIVGSAGGASATGGTSATLSPKAKAEAKAKDKKKAAVLAAKKKAFAALHKREVAGDKVAAANTARAAARGTSDDPVIQKFEALEMENELAGNTAGDTKQLTAEETYVQGLYNTAVKTHDYAKVSSLGQVLQGLIAAIAANTTSTAANTTATTVNTNAVTGSTSISLNGQDYAVGGTSSGNLANLAVGT